MPQTEPVAWRLLRALALSRYEDITGEDSEVWETLNRIQDDTVPPGDIRPLTTSLVVALTALTDRASRQIRTELTEQTRARAHFLLREAQEGPRQGIQDLGLLRRMACLTAQVADEVLDQPPVDTAPVPTSAQASVSSAPRSLPGPRPPEPTFVAFLADLA